MPSRMLWPRSGRCRTRCRSRQPASGTWVRPNKPPGLRNDRRALRQLTQPLLRARRSCGALRTVQLAIGDRCPTKLVHLLWPRTCDAAAGGTDGLEFADDGIGPTPAFGHLNTLALDHLGASPG